MKNLLTAEVVNINVVGINWALAVVLCVLIAAAGITACVLYGIHRHSLKNLQKLKSEQHKLALEDAENYKPTQDK